MSRLYRLSGFSALILGILGVLESLYLFGIKAITTSLVRDVIGNAIWCVASSNMTAYEDVETMNKRLNELSSLAEKPLLLLFSLILISISVIMIKSHSKK